MAARMVCPAGLVNVWASAPAPQVGLDRSATASGP